MPATLLVSARPAMPQSIQDMRAASPILWKWAMAFLLFFAVVYAGTFLDARLLNGVSVWEKPAKFFLSLSLHMATLVFGLSLLTESQRRSRLIRAAIAAFLAAAAFEMAYITLQAARGAASHFNNESLFTTIMYGLMGFGAVTLVAATGIIGFGILKQVPPSPIAFATGLGFMISAMLTLLVAGYLSENGGHWVGGDQTDATGLPFFHWSTSGGDLRVAHFFALHAMQALPLLGLLIRKLPMVLARPILLAGAVIWIAIVAATFIQALLGEPFIGL